MKSNAPDTALNTRRRQPPTRTRVDLTDTLNAEEVSDWLGIHRDEVLRKAAAGELPSLRIGRRRRFPREWIQAYLRDLATPQTVKASQPHDIDQSGPVLHRPTDSRFWHISIQTPGWRRDQLELALPSSVTTKAHAERFGEVLGSVCASGHWEPLDALADGHIGLGSLYWQVCQEGGVEGLSEWVKAQLRNKARMRAVTEGLIDEWLTRGRSRASEQRRQRYRSQVLGFVRWLDANIVPECDPVTVDDFTRRNIERWQKWLMESRLPDALDEKEEGTNVAKSSDSAATTPAFQTAGRTSNRRLAAIRAFTRWLHDEQYINEASQVDASLRTLENPPSFDELRKRLTALSERMEDVPTQMKSRTTLDEWGGRILRVLDHPLRNQDVKITGQLLVDAYRSLPTTACRLEFLDGTVWPGPASRTAKRILYRYVASTTRSLQLREWLARREGPRRTPAVKAVLLRSEAKAVLSHILPDHNVVIEARFPGLLHRLASQSPEVAASALAQRVANACPCGRAGMDDGAGRGRGTVRMWEETLLKLLAAGPAVRQTTLDLLPNIEVES